MRFWLAFPTLGCGNNGAQAGARPALPALDIEFLSAAVKNSMD